MIIRIDGLVNLQSVLRATGYQLHRDLPTGEVAARLYSFHRAVIDSTIGAGAIPLKDAVLMDGAR